MNRQERVFELLNLLNIDYEVTNHPAAFTIEEMDQLNLSQYGHVCKNLFLRDGKGKRHFLVVISKDKKADLNSLQAQLGCSRLSFASEARLDNYLKLKKGEVTPLGIINDDSCAVEVVFDKDLVDKRRLGVHPNDNTATVWLSFDTLKSVITHHNNSMKFVTI